ncbi:MAG: twin-arginine translocation signal domain-containing protein [Herpetosiphonaceae bacterium]|nr:twin-arginine translocation signal domain-containing protein [Herpetosiphonaceae bacterium]
MDDEKRISRRKFLKFVGVGTGAVVLTACSAAAPAADSAATAAGAATSAATTAPVTAATTAAAAATAVGVTATTADVTTAPAGGVQGPIPYPEGQIIAGGRAPKLFNLDQIAVYKKLDKYSEPDYIAKAVQAGKLPSVDKRLPETPQVIPNAFFSDGPGVYGGVLRDVWAAPTEGWNWGAGVSQGYFGINSIVVEELVKTGPMWLRGDKLEPLPNLAKDWQWSSDGMSLTMNLVKGIKWSDGQPFTADDVLFTWNDLILDPNVVRANSKRSSWQIGGKDINLEKVDDYTIKWTFPVAKPAYKLFDMNENYFLVAPAHIQKPLHPKYNKNTDYQKFQDDLPPNTLPVVTMGPWIPVDYKTDELMIFRRNPYYWKVDESGKQLPYLDEVVFEHASTGVVRTGKVIAGACDHTNVENPSTFNEVATKAQDPNAVFRVEWGPETLGFSLLINQSLNFGTTDDRTKELRKLFRDAKFRRALTQAIDRDGIAKSVAEGPFFRAWPGGLYPGSQFFDAASTVYYPFSLDTSKALLAELGFKEKDSNGILKWPSGPLAGQPLVIGLVAGQDAEGVGTIAEAVSALYKQVGIQVNYRQLQGNAMADLNTNGQWDMQVSRMGQEWGIPNVRSRDIAPIALEAPVFSRAGAGVDRPLQDFEKQMVDLVQKFAAESDSAKQKELMKQYQKLHTENVYTLGVIISRYGLGMSKTIKNVPIGCPAFFYQWDYDNFIPEQFWIAQADQSKVPETRPNVIPTYKA